MSQAQGSIVRVSNVSIKATESDIMDFFSFSGEIEHIELRRESEKSQVAFVTFKDPSALDTALLLSGATIVDQSVNIELAPVDVYVQSSEERSSDVTAPNLSKAEEVISSMLARGYVVGKDAMSKARAFDEKHKLTASASATVSNLDKKIGLTQKLSAGSTAVNERVKAVDQKFQVSEKTKTAFAVAEQKVNNAGSALLKNRYVLTGASWVTGAFSKVQKAAADVSQKTRDKVLLTQGSADANAGNGGVRNNETSDNNEYLRLHSVQQQNLTPPAAVSLSAAAESAPVRYPSIYDDSYPPVQSTAAVKPGPPPAQGLIL
eukprot:TRINITY_DN9114_c0_g1_i1.p1 TRINITY_DN9114_c0_g1~~TRINITY_DN9114_c0_g1_i1.p1  ORF type:complete len:319 (-),score=69.24 TRINITY_DN9114_c0_g1_i1:610-1566(-)